MGLNLDPSSESQAAGTSAANTAPAAKISLDKGQRVNLTKGDAATGIPGLTKIRVGLGWKLKDGVDADLDASVVILGGNDKMLPTTDPNKPAGLVFYNNLENPGIKHSGDARAGSDNVDDETIHINLDEVDPAAEALLIVATSFTNAAEPVTFGVVKEPIIRIYDDVSGDCLYSFELDEDASMDTAVELGRIYKKSGEWRFTSLGDPVRAPGADKGSVNGLADLMQKYEA